MSETIALWTRDSKAHLSKGNIADLLQKSAESISKNPLKLTLDWRKIKKAPGQINFSEYLDFQVYDQTRFDSETDRRRFLSDDLHWKLCYQMSDRKWDSSTEDKWMSETILKGSGIETTNTIGVLDSSDRFYGGIPNIENADQLTGLIKDAGRPVFAKLNGGIGSEGATRITHLGGDRFNAAGFGELDSKGLYQAMSQAPSAYMIQEELKNHPKMKEHFGERIATIRAMTFISDKGIRTPFALLKLPVGENIADNFWRPGNMLADIDQNTGKIRRAIRGRGPKMEVIENHPETGQKLTDITLPMWAEVQTMIDNVARLYAPVKFQSLDLAITDKGPTIVEINTGGSFYLPQMASGKGMLTDDFIDLLRATGCELDTSKL